MQYTFRFTGRTKGAIGIASEYTQTVTADSVESAMLKLYDTHEHIYQPRVIATSDATATN